jgi:hypothetical protein
MSGNATNRVLKDIRLSNSCDELLLSRKARRSAASEAPAATGTWIRRSGSHARYSSEQYLLGVSSADCFAIGDRDTNRFAEQKGRPSVRPCMSAGAVKAWPPAWSPVAATPPRKVLPTEFDESSISTSSVVFWSRSTGAEARWSFEATRMLGDRDGDSGSRSRGWGGDIIKDNCNCDGKCYSQQ